MPDRRHDRRTFLALTGAAAAGGGLFATDGAAQPAAPQASQAPQPPSPPPTSFADTAVLTIGYEERGDPKAFPILLLHGFPDDVRAWDDVVAPIVRAGYRTIVPYLRGYGPTRFRDRTAPRMAEQAAIGQDTIDLADALGLDRFAVVGYDWGGRAAAIAAVLQPSRVRAAVLIGGYTIQDTIAPSRPGPPQAEHRLWYQWYFNTPRGRAGLEADRRAICRYLWQTWSPTWRFTEETFQRTAASFDNPDFVDVVVHSYSHRIGNAPGEPRFAALERRLAERPRIEAPSITLYGADDGLGRPQAEVPPSEREVLPQLRARRVIAGAGHFLPREQPEAVSSALLELLTATR